MKFELARTSETMILYPSHSLGLLDSFLTSFSFYLSVSFFCFFISLFYFFQVISLVLSHSFLLLLVLVLLRVVLADSTSRVSSYFHSYPSTTVLHGSFLYFHFFSSFNPVSGRRSLSSANCRTHIKLLVEVVVASTATERCYNWIGFCIRYDLKDSKTGGRAARIIIGQVYLWGICSDFYYKERFL